MHDALLIEQVVDQAYDDDLEGTYRCSRASHGATQYIWVFEPSSDIGLVTYDSQTIVIASFFMMSSSCYMPLSSFDSNLISRLFQAYVGSMCIHAGRWEARWGAYPGNPVASNAIRQNVSGTC